MFTKYLFSCREEEDDSGDVKKQKADKDKNSANGSTTAAVSTPKRLVDYCN